MYNPSKEAERMANRESKHAERIVETAVALFKKNGYENVSVNEICKAAGLSRSSFYAAFSGKQDIIEYVLAKAKTDETTVLNHFMDAKNDFERMWILCDRYLSVAYQFGPELTGALMRLELRGELDILKPLHAADDWFIRLMRNCQQTGVILSRENAERMAPMGVDNVYMVTYDWCRRGGDFSLRREARIRSEIFYNVAPEYRWTQAQLENA